MPGRIPDDIDLGVSNPGEKKDFLLRVLGDHTAHPTTGGGEGHFDMNDVSAFGMSLHDQVVDEPEIDNIDWNFGIVTTLERLPNLGFLEGAEGGGWGNGGRSWMRRQPEGVPIFWGHSEKSAQGLDGPGPSKGLSDMERGSGGENDGVAGGDLDGFAIAEQFVAGNFGHIRAKVALIIQKANSGEMTFREEVTRDGVELPLDAWKPAELLFSDTWNF